MNSIVDLMENNTNISNEGGGFIQGTVTDNSDKDHAGMVKVEFTSWKKNGNVHEWIPLIRHYGGKTYGCYAVPEVGDTVIVGFISSNFRKPFVLGVLSPENASFDTSTYQEKNYIKKFKTKGGIDLSIDDESNKQSVKLSTPKGLIIFLKDETETILISDKTSQNNVSIDCKNGSIEIKTEKSLALVCGNCEIKLNGQSGELTISCNKLTIDAKQTGTIKGGQSLTLEGAMLKAEGKQTANIKGGTMMQIGGSIVKIN